MAIEVHFRLDHPRSNGQLKKTPVTVQAVLYVNDTVKPQKSTNIKIIPTHWDFTNQKVKSSFQGYAVINEQLRDMATDLLAMWKENKDADYNTLSALMIPIVKGEYALAKARKRDKSEKKSNPFSDFVNDFIEKCERGEIVREPGTIGTYRQTLQHIEDYAVKHSISLCFEVIDMDFYNGFMKYLGSDLNLNDNTAGKHIKNLKMFMGQAFDEDKHENLAFKKKKFKKLSYETDEVYLTSDEILKIYSLDLSGETELARIRDMFVFACWVGLRFGDLCNIRPEQIIQTQAGKFLRTLTEKTHEDVVIPFHPMAEAIYSLYNNSLPEFKKSDNADFNKALKDIARRANLTKKFPSKNIVRGKATVTYLEKCEMVSAHTARRSFATNCMLMGVPTRTIMSITGHKTEKAFNKYIRITKEEHAKIMMEHFNKSLINESGNAIMRKAN